MYSIKKNDFDFAVSVNAYPTKRQRCRDLCAKQFARMGNHAPTSPNPIAVVSARCIGMHIVQNQTKSAKHFCKAVLRSSRCMMWYLVCDAPTWPSPIAIVSARCIGMHIRQKLTKENWSATCGTCDETVGFSGCSNPEHQHIKICKYCDVDGSDYNGWDDECLECEEEEEEEDDN